MTTTAPGKDGTGMTERQEAHEAAKALYLTCLLSQDASLATLHAQAYALMVAMRNLAEQED